MIHDRCSDEKEEMLNQEKVPLKYDYCHFSCFYIVWQITTNLWSGGEQ